MELSDSSNLAPAIATGTARAVVKTVARATVGSRLQSRENNFDFIRLAAAFLVIFSHSWPIKWGVTSYVGMTPFGWVDISEPYLRVSGYCIFGELAVAIFFIISGLLVARSFLSDPKPITYLRKRCLRIFPGLVVCVLFCIFVVGPLFTTLHFREYLFNPETFRFARSALLYPNHYHLPGVFEDYEASFDRRYVVNGSLWSLPLEFLMYLAVPGFGVTALLKNKRFILGLTIGCGVWWIVAHHFFASGSPTAVKLKGLQVWLDTVPMLALLFFSGTVMLLYRDSIWLDWRIFVGCILLIVMTWQWTHDTLAEHLHWVARWQWQPWHGYLVLCLCLPYIVMYLAFVRIPVLQSVTKWGDFSYGVYLYGYPVQQMLMRRWEDDLPFPLFIGLSCLGTLVLAALSWHLVEKPFLKKTRHSARPQPGVEAPPVPLSRVLSS